jgi:hypothetical protein
MRMSIDALLPAASLLQLIAAAAVAISAAIVLSVRSSLRNDA